MKFSLFFFANGDAPAEQYRLLLDAARFADAEGLAAVWTPERHFHSFGAPFPNPAVTGAAVAAVTSRTEVRAGSVVLPLHDPLRVAEEWAVVDQISGGRAGVALASGWNPQDFVLAPAVFGRHKQVLREQLAELRTLWAGGTVTRIGPEGVSYQVRTHPRPRRDGLPLWITAAGSPATFALAGELGTGVLTHLLGQSTDDLAERLADYGTALEEHGHPPEAERVAVMLHTHLDPDPSAALDRARPPLKEYLRSSLDLFGLRQPGTAPVGTAAEADLDDLLEIAFQRFVPSCLIGSPETALPLVTELAELGVDEIACLIDFGLPTDQVLAGLDALAALNKACAEL
ncbi:MupA/Atu3671 family FMN-dependent luciferase-like monooxygenase [Kitasatospora sp. NPDC006697]|uniref:MupA/Atu3671 family FMN-dependent luciferase-like monooxygenase n=1 Tax=Kitasatospora sp. NPDC006697 TaxID=3364020 RepID=UPI00368D81B4